MHFSRTAKSFFGLFAFLILVCVPSFGQITINLPKIPKIKKPDTVTKTDNSTDNTQKTEQKNSTGGSCSGDPVLDIHMADLAKTREQAAAYTPGARDYYVQDFNDNENIYLKASLSRSRRQEWLARWPENMVKCLTPALDDLASVAKKTLPGYTLTGYNLHNAAEEKLLRAAVNDISQATVFKTGLMSPTWKIAKDDYNFPTSRYKYGAIWAKYPTTDDGFCRIIYVNIIQDYAGGGTYGESYGRFIKSEYAGCPPGK